MTFTSVQWNIGGGNIRSADADPLRPESYSEQDLSYFVEKLRSYSPDLITLQESHADADEIQARVISEQLGLPHFINDEYDQSHIDPSQRLCQSVISRFPIKDHSFDFFFNPRYRRVMENGEEWTSHDKGISTCAIDEIGLTVQTLHLIPFRAFDVDFADENARRVTASIEELSEKEASPYLLQGDFNNHDLKALLPGVFQNGLQEVGGDSVTTPKGRIYDHVLARGMRVVSHAVDSEVLSDHFPLVTAFELN